MSLTALGHLLHLSDPTLPIGGFTQSNGLETYVQQGIVHDLHSAEQFITHMLQYNIKYNDAAFVYLAYRASENGDIDALVELDAECHALKSPREIREGSQKLGTRFIKIFIRHQPFDLADAVMAKINDKTFNGHYAILFGMYAQLKGLSPDETLLAFYYNACIGMITNAVKLVPLGQLDGQDLMFKCQSLLPRLVETTQSIERDHVGLCQVGFDIRCMQHEQLYSRLYMS